MEAMLEAGRWFGFRLGWLLLLTWGAWSGCRERLPVPKPRGYFRIDMPERLLRDESSGCGPRFELPKYAGCVSASMSETEGFCGFNVVFPAFQAVLHCTHVSLDGSTAMLDALVADAHDLAFNHDIKATGIGRQIFTFPEQEVYGLMYDLRGPVATPVQFFATDSSHHFVRGSLYFNHEPNPDSLRPALAQVRADVVHMMETMKWNP